MNRQDAKDAKLARRGGKRQGGRCVVGCQVLRLELPKELVNEVALLAEAKGRSLSEQVARMLSAHLLAWGG